MRILLGGLGLWVALNAVIAARLIRRADRSGENLPEAVVLPLRHARRRLPFPKLRGLS